MIFALFFLAWEEDWQIGHYPFWFIEAWTHESLAKNVIIDVWCDCSISGMEFFFLLQNA